MSSISTGSVGAMGISGAQAAANRAQSESTAAKADAAAQKFKVDEAANSEKAGDIADTDIKALVRFARNKKIDFVIVGPEDPLTLGVVDLFEKKGLRIYGPNAAAAVLEGRKVFTKNFLKF